MWNEITAWQEQLHLRPDLSAKTIALYTQDVRRFAIWLQHEHPGLKATEVTSIDAKTYRHHLLAKRSAPTTINRALISLMLFFDTLDGTNPFRHLTMIEMVEPAPVALSKTEWNAVRRCAEQLVRRDHGLALALARHTETKLCRTYLLCGYEAPSLTRGLPVKVYTGHALFSR